MVEELLKRIDKTETCWNWTGEKTGQGYGRFRTKMAHRLVYEALVGKIPEGLQIDHLCKNKRCVNPAHLEPVTQQENMRRSDCFSAVNARKEYCINGHPFSGKNMRVYLGKFKERRCKACNRINDLKWKIKVGRVKVPSI